jgi:hypothetical protein
MLGVGMESLRRGGLRYGFAKRRWEKSVLMGVGGTRWK